MKSLITLSLAALIALQLTGCGGDSNNNRQGPQGSNNQELLNDQIAALPRSELSDEQRYTLAYMWNEEKLAKDIYLALNALTPHTTLSNIANNAESTHQSMVEELIEKYDLNILNPSDYSGGYNEAALDAYSSGLYSIEEVGALYALLYSKGSASIQDALEVGCMVEVTDINDLDHDIAVAQGADDLVLVFENLRQGSYNHYWAFDSALKNMGITQGCCVLGDTYCKTTSEYPQNAQGGHR